MAKKMLRFFCLAHAQGKQSIQEAEAYGNLWLSGVFLPNTKGALFRLSIIKVEECLSYGEIRRCTFSFPFDSVCSSMNTFLFF